VINVPDQKDEVKQGSLFPGEDDQDPETEGQAEEQGDDQVEDQADDEECDPEEGCEPEEQTPAPKETKRTLKGSTLDKKPPAAKPAASPATSKHIFPFNIRYASEILDLVGFVEGTAYSESDIKDLLIQNGYTEFADTAPAFHKSAVTNTLVITIKGSSKGGPSTVDWHTLHLVQLAFQRTYDMRGTEDRALIYQGPDGGMAVVTPSMVRRTDEVKCDMPLTIEIAGEPWDLAFDLHSHHRMGVFWSPTDNANERIRGPVFGVFSWKGYRPAWLFRRFDGTEFEELTYEQVIGDGQQ
jgi:hypothetical protein